MPSSALPPLLPDRDWRALSPDDRRRQLAVAGFVVIPGLLPPAMVALLRQRVARLPTSAGGTPALQTAVDVGAREPLLAAAAAHPAIVDHLGAAVTIAYWRWAPGAPPLDGPVGRLALVLLDDVTPATAPPIAGAPPGLLTAGAGAAILSTGERPLATAPHRGLAISERLVVRAFPGSSA